MCGAGRGRTDLLNWGGGERGDLGCSSLIGEKGGEGGGRLCLLEVH